MSEIQPSQESFEDVLAEAAGYRIDVPVTLQRWKDVNTNRSFVGVAYRELVGWADQIEGSSLIGSAAAVSDHILALQRNVRSRAESILAAMAAEGRTQATDEEERQVAAPFFYWRMARADWDDHRRYQ